MIKSGMYARQNLIDRRGQEISASLAAGDFYFDYQAQVRIQNGITNITGAEMLIRWEHPELGLLPPNTFIDIAELTGLIIPMGRFALRTGCEQLIDWSKHRSTKDLEVHVNVSQSQISNEDFVDDVERILNETGANPKLLKIELTESMPIASVPTLVKKMKNLMDIGVTFSLDDFGTGFSSMSSLSQLPIHLIKIDQCFTRQLSTNNLKNLAITASMFSLGSKLNVEVLAEGVETIEQLEILEGLGCERFQGYLFARPMGIEAFNRFNSSFIANNYCNFLKMA